MSSTSKWSREKPALREHARPIAGQARRRDRVLAWAFTAGVHLIVFAYLFWPSAAPPPAEPLLSPLLVSVAVLPQPKPPGPPDQTEPGGSAPTLLHPIAPVPVPVTIIMADDSDILSASQLAGTASVGESGGGGGGGCDLALAVQRALRRDSLVRSAVEGANRLGRAVMMWNGDWVRTGGQDGKGLSAVREAIMWEVAFAPQSCRNERMHKPVLLSLADGSTRFAIGSGDWRWSDLLGLRKVPRDF
jgi:hypothetical protein